MDFLALNSTLFSTKADQFYLTKTVLISLFQMEDQCSCFFFPIIMFLTFRKVFSFSRMFRFPHFHHTSLMKAIKISLLHKKNFSFGIGALVTLGLVGFNLSCVFALFFVQQGRLLLKRFLSSWNTLPHVNFVIQNVLGVLWVKIKHTIPLHQLHALLKKYLDKIL